MVRMILMKIIPAMLKKRLSTQQGFTLVELLVTLVIAGLVFAGVYQIYINSIRTTTVQDQVADMQQTARVVMGQITRELRLAGYSSATPSGVAGVLNLVSNPIDLSAGGTFIIQGDFDVDNTLNRVTYRLNTDDADHPWLMRQMDTVTGAVTTGPDVKFGSNVENLVLTFYDENNCKLGLAGCPVLDGSAVTRVTVALTVRTADVDLDFTDAINDGYRRRVLEADVKLRNRGNAGGDVTPPLCPTAVVAVADDCRIIQVSWQAPDDPYDDLAGYYIYFNQAAINTATSPFQNVTDNGAATYTQNITVSADGLWNIAVSSYDRSGNLCDADAANGNPPADPVIATGSPVNTATGNVAPSKPGAATAVPTDNQVTLTWADVLTDTDGSPANDLVGYRVYRATQPDMSDAVMIANETDLSITQVFGGGSTSVTRYVDNSANTPAPDGGPINCTIYYYQVSVVDNCNTESARTTVRSLKPDGTSSPGVTPPDNAMSPPAPTITALLAGDDTSTIIVNWTVPAPIAGESTPVGVRISWRVTGTGTWNPSPGPAPIDIPITTLPQSGIEIIVGLDPNTYYEAKLTTYDDPVTECGDEVDSGISEVYTGACAPQNRAHKIVPGISAIGTSVPEDGTAVIGSLSPSGQRYVTWVADPVDCTPDSSFFDDPGFDYKNPPAYTEVAYDTGAGTSAKVEFYVNDSGGADLKADLRYGTAATGTNPGNLLRPTNSGNVDYAPRGGDGYYHFPSDPLDSAHLDTARFCDARYDFKIISVDGEQYNAVGAIPLEIKNGGIEVDSGVTVSSDISSPDDTHHIVRLAILNTNAVLDLKLNKIALKWDNVGAQLEKLEVLDFNSKAVIGEWNSAGGTPSGLTLIGTELTLNPVPTLSRSGAGGNSDRAYLRLTFKDSSGILAGNVDMRAQGSAAEETITITKLEQQDAAAAPGEGICISTSAGSNTVHMNPTFVTNLTVQDQPAANTAPTKTPGVLLAPLGQSVTVTTRITEQGAQPIARARFYFNLDPLFQSLAPVRPSSPGPGGSYLSFVDGTYDSIMDLWSFVIPAGSPSRVWYYLEAIDGTVTDLYDRNFDIYPDSGVFTYDQGGELSVTLIGDWGQTTGCSIPQDVNVLGTVMDQGSNPVSGASVDIVVTDGTATETATVTSDASGNFAYVTPNAFNSDATVSVTASKSGYTGKSCALPSLTIAVCADVQTATCN